MADMFDKASWIGVPIEEVEEKNIIQGQMNGHFAYFRKTFMLKDRDAVTDCTIDITANSRYRLWVNGVGVQSGPLRSDRYRHFYETIDISDRLVSGENVIAVQVLLVDRAYYKQKGFHPEGIFGVDSLPYGHRLAVEGKVTLSNNKGTAFQAKTDGNTAEPDEKKALAGNDTTETEQREIDLTTGLTGWKVYLDNSYYLDCIPVGSDCMGATIENIDMSLTPHDYKLAGFDDSGWREAETIETVVWSEWSRAVGIYQAFDVKPRPVALLYEEPMLLEKELGTALFAAGEDGAVCSAEGENKASEQDRIIIQPGLKETILFGLPCVMNMFPAYRFSGGKGSKVTFTYFERFEKKDASEENQVARDDFKNGDICEFFMRDTIILDGGNLCYEPFWIKSFRFLQIEIEAKEEAVTFYRPTAHRAGYPLNPRTRIRSSEPWVNQLYTMCQRTLEGCMLETYMDCPTWEQFQYPMDTRLQILFTYICSTDTAMARKALEDFHSTQLPDGIILGKAPTGSKQVITTFSLHYIFIIWEFYQRTKDALVLKRYRGDVDDILNYFDGCIGESGLIEQVGYWPFVDWQDDWKETAGIPKAYSYGPSTLINLIYAYALLDGAHIMEASGRPYMADEYRKRQKSICDLIQEKCWDSDRQMYREGPSFAQFTQQTQSWATLNGMMDRSQAAITLGHTFDDPDVLGCYFSTCYELFRACQWAGVYEVTDRKLAEWRRLIDMHCGTCPETPVNNRSECHAWSALPMYELVATVAGIRRNGEDPDTYIVDPHMNGLKDLRGEVCTDKGMITFDYHMVDGIMKYEVTAPEGIRLVYM